MGWTHYWRGKPELSADSFQAAITDIQKIISTTEIPLAGSGGQGEPLISSGEIIFNGITESHCEPAWMSTIIQEEFDKYIAKNRIVWQGPKVHVSLLQKIQAYIPKIQGGYYKLGLHTCPIRSEWLVEAYVSDLDTTLTGRIDLYDPEQNIIYDLKASDDEQWFDWEQGLFYSLIVSIKVGIVLAKFGQFVPLRPENVSWQNIDNKNLTGLNMELGSSIQQIKDQIFEPKRNNRICAHCEVKEFCRHREKRPFIVPLN